MPSHITGSLAEPSSWTSPPYSPSFSSQPIGIEPAPPALRADRVLQLADALEQRRTPVPGFSMAPFYSSAHSIARNVNRIRDDRGGITAGLAAHTVKLFHDIPVSTGDVHGAAMQILGLTAAQAEDLFGPRGIRSHEVTREVAVATLRRLAETGKVLWTPQCTGDVVAFSKDGR